MDYVLSFAASFVILLWSSYCFKFGKMGFSFTNVTLLLCTSSLIFKASGHVWCSDGAGRDYGGFDYEEGNAHVITTILFLYGEMQYVWVFWNIVFLFYEQKLVKVSVYLHFFASLFMFSFVLVLWPYIKEYPRIQPPVGEAKRPGNYLWLVEFIIPGIIVLFDMIKKIKG